MSRGSNLAHKIEASVIEPTIRKPQLSLVSSGKDSLEELFARKPIRRHVQEFGHILGLVGLCIALYIALRKGSLADAGAVTLASLLIVTLCSFFPRVMLPVWRGWMALGGFLEKISTAVILGLMWGGLVVPIGFVLKILGIKVMDTTYRAEVSSYWLDIPPAKADFTLLERQY